LNFTSLAVDESPAATVSGLPNGDLVAFGFFVDRSSGGFDAFDSFAINATAIPELASLSSIGLLGLAALRRRR